MVTRRDIGRMALAGWPLTALAKPNSKIKGVMVGVQTNAELTCPECGKHSPGYDTRPREWRHLDTCQFKTILRAKVPRGECPEHGVRQIRVPWAERGSQFTALFERLAIDWLKVAAQSAVADNLRVSWSEVHGIMTRAVERGLARRQVEELHLVGVDEKAFSPIAAAITIHIQRTIDKSKTRLVRGGF